MSWDIDPRIVTALVDGIEEVAAWAWKRIAGDGDDDKLAELKKAAAEAAALALHSEILAQATRLGMELRVEELGSLAAGVLKAMDAVDVSRRTVPPLDIFIEEVQ